MGHHPDRNAQFENIAGIRREYESAGDPVISIDTKKKELLGNFHRDGRTLTPQTVETFDHDFPGAGTGKLIPHGIFDLANNHAAVRLNTSHDTGELCCDSIALWWRDHGRAAYPDAKRLLILCDGGGSNRATHYLFKEDLQRYEFTARNPWKQGIFWGSVVDKTTKTVIKLALAFKNPLFSSNSGRELVPATPGRPDRHRVTGGPLSAVLLET